MNFVFTKIKTSVTLIVSILIGFTVGYIPIFPCFDICGEVTLSDNLIRTIVLFILIYFIWSLFEAKK